MYAETYGRPRGSGFSRRGKEPVSPGGGDSKDLWSGSKSWELNRNLSTKNLANKVEDAHLSIEMSADTSRNQGRGQEIERAIISDKLSPTTRSEDYLLNTHSVARSESLATETSPISLSAPVATSAAEVSQTEKMWHYKDPSGKVQGPFSMVQLRKWSNTGYFPNDLKIWRTNRDENSAMLLNDALAGKFQRELPQLSTGTPKVSILHDPHLSFIYTKSLLNLMKLLFSWEGKVVSMGRDRTLTIPMM